MVMKSARAPNAQEFQSTSLPFVGMAVFENRVFSLARSISVNIAKYVS
jgi:hypothetical protein